MKTASARYSKNLSKTTGNFADFLCADPCSRDSAHNLADIPDIGSNHRQVTRQGLFDRGRGAFTVRAENHRVGRAVVPWHFAVVYTEDCNQLCTDALFRKSLNGCFCQIVPLDTTSGIKRE